MERLSIPELDPGSGTGAAAQIRSRVALMIADGRLGPGDRLPSVRALAAQLGISINTVRAAYARLAGDGLVGTRHGVGTVVLDLGGAPPIAADPAMGSDTVAVLVGGLDPFYLPLVRGVEDVAAREGMLVVIGDTHDTGIVAEALIRRLVARGIAGIIAVSHGGASLDRGPRRAGRGSEPPIVFVDQPQRSGHVILFDGAGGGRLATDHLFGHSHRRIGIVTAPLAWPNVREVHDGYASAHATRRVPTDRALVAEVGAFSLAAGRAGLARLLALADPPTAVFAAGETLALGVLAEAKARGLKVPGDLALAGYTDSPTAALVEPPLTMVAVPAREVGMRAMEALAACIAGQGPPILRDIHAGELVVRRSCGCGGEP